ncbi:hypothetical protein B0H15DRAFT_806245 [Mycena belliarum]|uniref:Uncharacterized protein n=1 Tax=Mycena belliarum TaxID=1033014 RepID=A0AAD6XF62_9AGAR|nr:hypothetical protein B0H15DRAFT_806245 [Mycena belliae]
MANSGDSDMPPPFNDDGQWIEDRWSRGQYFPRGPSGYFAGNERAPTWVTPLGTSLGSTHPPFRGFTDAPVSDRVQHASGTPGTAAAVPSAPPAHRATVDLRNANTAYYAPSSTTSSRGSDSSRHWESPEYRSDVARHEYMTSHERFRDEPYWGAKRPRYDPRNARPDLPDRDVLDRERFEMRSAESERQDRNRARDERNIRSPQGPQRDERRNDDAPPRLFPSPDPRGAPRGPDGHPMAPRTAAKYAGTYEGSDDDPAPDPKYVGGEEDRILRSRAKSSRNKGRDTGTTGVRSRDDRLGLWRYAEIADITQAINLCEWLDLGEESAYKKFLFIVQNSAAAPTDFRTEGEVYVLKHQQDLERNWWILTRGAARLPRSERLQGGPPGSNGLRPATNQAGPARTVTNAVRPVATAAGPPHTADTTTKGPAWSFGSSIAIAADGPAKRDEEQGYLGTAPVDIKDVAPPAVSTEEWRAWRGLPNSLGTTSEVLHWYAFATIIMWTSGVRNAHCERPRADGDDAYVRDALAFQTLVALGPADRRNYAHQWRMWYETMISMLSIPGLFAHIVRVGKYPAAALALMHYPFLTDNFTMPLAAAWLVQHGVAATGADIEHLESFARSRRNMRTNIADLNNVGWAETPRDVADAMSADPASIPPWRDLHHAPLRPGATPEAPPPAQAPAASSGAPAPPEGLAASMHAPMDVDTTKPSRSDSEESPVHPAPPPDSPAA